MEAKDFITPGITLLGFFVVNFLAEAYKRFKSGSVLAAGLAGELSSYDAPFWRLLQSMNMIIAIHTPPEAAKAKLPFRGKFEIPKDRVFEANVATLGLLDVELASKVAFMYGHLSGFRAGFRELHDHHELMERNEILVRAQSIKNLMVDAKKVYDELIPMLHARSKLSWYETLSRFD